VLQVEALRDNLQLVGAQKVLHEQQAEMWKQKHAAMEKLVDHLELLVASQQKQLIEQQPSAAASLHAMTRETGEDDKHASASGAADPDHVHSGSPEQQHAAGASRPIPSGLGEKAVGIRAGLAGIEGNLFEHVVLLGAREQAMHDALRVGGLMQLQHLETSKLASFPADPSVESLEEFCFPSQVPSVMVPGDLPEAKRCSNLEKSAHMPFSHMHAEQYVCVHAHAARFRMRAHTPYYRSTHTTPRHHKRPKSRKRELARALLVCAYLFALLVGAIRHLALSVFPRRPPLFLLLFTLSPPRRPAPISRKDGDAVDDVLLPLGVSRAFFSLSTGPLGEEQVSIALLSFDLI